MLYCKLKWGENLMKIIDKYFKSLSFLGLDNKQEMHSINFSAFKSGSNLQFCNRAFINENITMKNLNEVKSFFSTLPFSIWINEENKHALHLVNEAGFNFHTVYPLMSLNLNKIHSCPRNNKISVKQITTEYEILNLWVSLVVKSYNIIDVLSFQKYVSCLINKADFYIGYYEDKPAATNMTIFRDDTIDIHWIGTVPEYRKKGLGEIVTCFPLLQRDTQATKSILYASDMGKPLYEKMGFAVEGACHVYKL